MSNEISRRHFVKAAGIGGISILTGFKTHNILTFGSEINNSELYVLGQGLLGTWLEALVKLQITDKNHANNYGGIICPEKKIIHGRVGDTIYPFLYQAKVTGQSKFLDAARLLYQWMGTNVSQPDGSWLNEPKKNSWKGTTVFSLISLAEALKSYPELIDFQWKTNIENRLKKAGDYVFDNFSLEYGNINYPINAAYALFLLGELLDIKKFKDKGSFFAAETLKAFTKEGFISGEGAIYNVLTKKVCYAVDLGYNVEESLPALAMYGLLAKDEEVLEIVTRSLQTHMEFMLPDGAWDNSWGTRNYKWTYWGSRTTDGCQPAYALLADRDPRFYKVALLNTRLLQSCTHDGLLHGGLHSKSAGILPSVHHTFCHAKALASILSSPSVQRENVKDTKLPREQTKGISHFEDISTWLISNACFKATVTGYDREYKETKNGHPTGGALTMLWNEKAGPIISASMNEYQLFEADNMQENANILQACLTPRVELHVENDLFMNISDLNAFITTESINGVLTVHIASRLVDKNQQSPLNGEIRCFASYTFQDDTVTLKFSVDKSLYDSLIKIIIPVISQSSEAYHTTDTLLVIKKEKATVSVSSKSGFHIPNKRVFNFVPGLEAFSITTQDLESIVAIKVF